MVAVDLRGLDSKYLSLSLNFCLVSFGKMLQRCRMINTGSHEELLTTMSCEIQYVARCDVSDHAQLIAWRCRDEVAKAPARARARANHHQLLSVQSNLSCDKLDITLINTNESLLHVPFHVYDNVSCTKFRLTGETCTSPCRIYSTKNLCNSSTKMYVLSTSYLVREHLRWTPDWRHASTGKAAPKQHDDHPEPQGKLIPFDGELKPTTSNKTLIKA